MYCSRCCVAIPGRGQFCPHCGTQLGDFSDRRVVTVLFTDMSGFTSMSENLDPEEVTEIVNALFEVLVEPIYRLGGVVDKYIGDALMALFGAPVAHEDDAERAVRAAWEMQRITTRFADTLARERGIPVSIRVGINTGLVVAGAVGSTSHRADYTVMGDTVNLAQRMEASANPGKVLVTAETYRQARGGFRFKALEPFRVKGKAHLIEAYDLLGPISRSTKLRLDAERLVGRERELETLHRCLVAARRARPQIVVITGEAGTGKSALVSDFLASEHFAPTEVLQSSCISYERGNSYQMLSRLVGAPFGLSEEIVDDEARSNVPELPTSTPVRDPRKLALVGQLFGLVVDHPEVECLSPQQLQTGAFLAINEFLLQKARNRFLTLAIEDLHWADEASCDWLEGFLDQLGMFDEPSTILILLQTRPDGAHLRTQYGEIEVKVLEIGPLSKKESLDLALRALGAPVPSVSPEVMQLLQEGCGRAAGNPYYTTELARGLVDAGVIVPGENAWFLAKPGAAKALPTSIHATIAARLDLLPGHLRSLVLAASILGKRFDLGLFTELVGDEIEAVTELASRRILYRDATSEVGFAQAMIQEVAYEQLLLARRRNLHRQAGALLEARAARDARVSPAAIARHYVAAGDAANATKYLFQAAEKAQRSFANAQARQLHQSALEWLDRVKLDDCAIDLPTRGQILLHLGRLETVLGDLPAAEKVLRAAQSECGPGAETSRLVAEVHERQGDLPRAFESFELALSLAADDHLEAARAMLGKGNVLRRQGKIQDAIELVGGARFALEELGHASEAAYARSLMGICFFRQGDLKAAIAEHQRALQLRETIQDIDGIAKSFNNLGIVDSYAGNWGRARDYYCRALDLFRKLGDRHCVTMTLVNLGDLVLKQGHDELAERHFREGLKLAQQMGDRVNYLYLLANLGEVYLTRGAGREALDCIDRCLELARATENHEATIDLQAMRGRGLLLMGDLAEGHVQLVSALELAEFATNTATAGIIERSLAEWAELAGDVVGAREYARRSEARLRPSGQKYELGRTLAVLGRLLPEPENLASAREAWEILTELGAQAPKLRLPKPVGVETAMDF